jgi:signal transduction histidine kinase
LTLTPWKRSTRVTNTLSLGEKNINKYKRVSIILICSLITLLVVNNAIYYFISKQTLEQQTLKNLVDKSKVINNFLENSREGAHFVENLVGEKLRSDAIAIQSQLDPDINKVTNAQLEMLSQKLNLKAITLLAKKGNSFILSKSSLLEELNVNTEKWGLWNKAFLELYEKKNVSALNWGQSLQNYWTGPYSVSDTNAEELYKYGYYYDGSTNYLINPFISDKVFKDYDSQVGINAFIKDTITSNSTILEVSGINPATFGKEQVEVTNGAGQKYNLRYFIPIFFGSYNFKNEKYDTAKIQEAILSKQPVSYKAKINGKTVFKTFIPVFSNKIDELGVITKNSKKELDKTINYYVMGITIDYQEIQNQLNQILINLFLVVIVITIICVIILFVLNYYFSKSKDEAVNETQATYIEELNNLFTTIRGQRHDFLHHISTIHAFVELDRYAELKNYTNEMVGDISKINDIINIGQPAIAALIQSKIVQAERKDITINFSFANMESFPDGVRSVDFVRFIGNLLDNAFDEVMKLPPEERNIEVVGKIYAGTFQISVKNSGIIDNKVKDKLFETGYTSKTAGNHSGLGLAITMDIVKKYKGTIKLDSTDGVKFIIEIPIHQYSKAI